MKNVLKILTIILLTLILIWYFSINTYAINEGIETRSIITYSFEKTKVDGIYKIVVGADLK